MVTSNLNEQILEYIRSHGPLKAKQVASALGVDRTIINRALYGPLRTKVRQSKQYTWTLIEESASRQEHESKIPSNSRENLFQYYLDCLSQDDDSGVSAFADSKFDLDYAELQDWPFDTDQPDFTSEPLRKLAGRQKRQARKKTLWLGYPVSIRHVRGRNNWEGEFLEPLLIWPQDPDADGLGFLPEPLINTRALRGIVASENILEEAAQLVDELGLDSSDLPPLDELAARLRELRPEWKWQEALAPATFRSFGELRKIKETGIYNSAIVVLTERSPFTVGLERELTDLRNVSENEIAESSLGTLLGEIGFSVSLDGPLLEPAPLNTEQRAAVRQALTEPLTVVTGPPGTGKSQVVTAILVNAAWRGMRVLFASKNNKAVDVVMERVNALSARPVMLRLGTRALQEQLAQHITTILSALPTQSDRQAYSENLAKLNAENDLLEQAGRELDEIIEFRNKVDKVERIVEDTRQRLPDAIFRNAAQVSLGEINARIDKLAKAVRRSDQSEAPLLERLVWFFIRASRLHQANLAANECEATLKLFGFHVSGGSPITTLNAAKKYFEALKTARTYHLALEKLATTPDPGTLANKIAKQNKKISELSAETWNNWTLLLPDRLNDRDRKALGDYAAILRTISRANEEGGNIAAQIWRRYYSLASETTKALPCWAITSLSVRGRVPFVGGEFDLVVIDEASQCDIASAIPLLFRAKRAVVIGDPQQLRHISRLSEQRDQALMVKHNLLENPGPSWGYRANGLYDLAASKAKSESIVVLRDHHRSHADIINFSNKFFYSGRLRVATNYRLLKRLSGPAVRWVNVAGEVTRPVAGGALNRAEATAVVEELRHIAITQRFVGEIGVVTPFRAQANLIDELISQDDALAPVLASRNFMSETAHKFQGDERDLIIFSPVISHNMPAGASTFLKTQGNLFNVGITRARGGLVVVGDAATCAGCEIKYLSAFASYVANKSNEFRVDKVTVSGGTKRQYPTVAHPERVSDWEKVLYSALVDAGLNPIPQFDVDQYALDFAVIRPNGRRLNIEVDGEHYHRDWDGELVRRDQIRNLRLIEMGWDVLRFWVYEVRDNLPNCTNRVTAWVESADAMPYSVDQMNLIH